MPQLRWTLLFLGVVFVILLAWIERRRQRQRFTEHAPAAEREHALDPLGGSGSAAYREASLTLPEMRAREFSPPQDLPIVEIEEDSLNARRVEVGEPLLDPPTLSLPILDAGPVKNRDRTEPTMSATDWIKTGDSDDVPRLDIPAPKRTLSKIELAVAEHTLDETAEREFNDAVFGDAGLGPGNDTVSQSEIEAAAAEAEAYANQRQAHQQMQADQPQPPTSPVAASRSSAPSAALEAPTPEAFGGSSFADVGDTVERPRPPPFIPADVTPVVEPIVEWPADDQRRVVALRLVAPPPDRLAGRALRLALASEGFVLGKFQIFHKPDDQGRAVLSAANLSKPGTFDLATMDVQRFGGLSLFVVLPGPKPPLKAFEELLSTARNLNERLQGALQDERGGPLTPTRIATLRESLGGDATS